MCFLALFVVAEALYHFASFKAEHSRKVVHVGTGLLTLLFPIWLHAVWQVVVLCGSFFILLVISMRFKFLQSVNAIERRSSGSLLFPVIVALVFVFYQYQDGQLPFYRYLYFYLPILVMAICDPIAALVGNYYKRWHIGIGGKTLAGSLGFFFSAFVVSSIVCFMFNRVVGVPAIIGFCFALSLLTTLAERYSNGGWDNFTIPVIVMVLLLVLNTFC